MEFNQHNANQGDVLNVVEGLDGLANMPIIVDDPDGGHPCRIIKSASTDRVRNKIELELSCGHTVEWDRPNVRQVVINPNKMVHCPACKKIEEKRNAIHRLRST